MNRYGFAFLLSGALAPLSIAGVALADYRTVLSCDGGTARILVDTAERRNVRLLISGDDRVANYLTGWPAGRGGYSSSAFWDEYNGSFDGRASAAVSARLGQGVFFPRDFRGFSVQRAAFSEPFSKRFTPDETRVFRAGPGLKVVLFQGEYDPSTLPSGVSPHAHEVKNWYFRQCQEINL